MEGRTIFQAQQEAVQENTECVLQEIEGEECKGEVVRAHTISKRQALESIAGKAKQVIEYNPSRLLRYSDKRKVKPEEGLVEISVKRGTTFKGLCQGHDNELFRCLDTQEWEGTPEQIAAIGARSVIREYWAKKVDRSTMRRLENIMSEGDPMREYIQQRAKVATYSLALVRPHVEEWMSAVRGGGEMEARTYEWKDGFGIGWSGGFYPEMGVDGRKVQDVFKVAVKEMITTGTATRKGRIITVITWKKKGTLAAERFVEALERSGNREQAIINMIFSYTEAFYMNPRWWNRQSLGTKRKALQRMYTSHETHDYGNIRANGEVYRDAVIERSSVHG